MTRFITGKDGNVRVARDGETIADGDTLTVNMMLMDTVTKASGAAQHSDNEHDARRVMREAEKLRLSNAWKNQTEYDAPAPQLLRQQQPAATVNDSYARYEARLCNRWKDCA